MSILRNRISLLITLTLAVFSLAPLPAAAQDMILSNNSGVDNAVFYIEGEPSLVINGFDLTPLGVQVPTALMAVSISVDTPVPGSYIQLVIYEDANGGSPVDATLVYRQYVSLDQVGVNRVVLERPVIISEPVFWVGFYLPIGFRFHADRSGASVLTYWAWTPGGSFDLASLASAEVLGPGDGSEPVSIEMGGIARINAVARSPEYEEIAAAYPLTEQVDAVDGQDLSGLRSYEACHALLHDPADRDHTLALTFPLYCREAEAFEAPYMIANPPDQILEADRVGPLYKLSTLLREDQLTPGRTSQLPGRVTHCFRVAPEYLERAVIGEVRESETAGERWYMLPSVRINDVVCAEVSVAHYLSYFIARTVESAPNINLVVGYPQVVPHPLTCGVGAMVYVPVVNTGTNWFRTRSGHVSVAVEDFHVITGVSVTKYVLQVNTDQFGPGVRRVLELGPIPVANFANELHRLEVRLDDGNLVPEVNEVDNIWFTEYVLSPWDEEDACADPEKLARREKEHREEANLRADQWALWVAHCADNPLCDLESDGEYDMTVNVEQWTTQFESLCRRTTAVCSWESADINGSPGIRITVRLRSD